MTTTRDPLAVLRLAAGHLRPTLATDEYVAIVEAIAQVEALVAEALQSEDAMRWTVQRLTQFHGLPASELLTRADAMRSALEAFTPGQDSEKCGCTQIDYIKGRACESCVEAQEGQDSEGGGNG